MQTRSKTLYGWYDHSYGSCGEGQGERQGLSQVDFFRLPCGSP